MRDSQYKSCAVQNRFTAYLIAAIRNYKRTYSSLQIKKSSSKAGLTKEKCCRQQVAKKCNTKRPPQMRRPERSGYSRLLRVVQTC